MTTQAPAKTRTPSKRELAKSGKAPVALPPEETPAPVEEPTPVVVEEPSLTVKGPRVLEDPVANAKLVRMRAKWTAIRRERDVARIEEEMETASTPAERREVSGRMKTAKSVLAEAQTNERYAHKAYRDLLEARKAAKTASPTAETDPGEA